MLVWGEMETLLCANVVCCVCVSC